MLTFLLWIFGSLLAVSFIGDLPWIALLLTGLTGIGMGLSVHADDAGARLTLGNPQHQVSHVTLERVFPASAFNVPMMALIIMLLLSLWVSPDAATGFGPLAHLLVGIAIFYILSEVINTPNRLCWAICGLVAVGVLIALLLPIRIGLAGKFWPFTQVPESIRQTLVIGLNPNALAGGLIPVLSIATALFLNAPLEWLDSNVGRYGRRLLAIALIAMFTALLLSQSRGGIMAMGVALLFLITSKRWWIGGMLVGTLILFSQVAVNGTATYRVLAFSYLTGAVDGLPNREEIWWRAVFMLQRVPYTGIGLGAFSHVVSALYPMLVTGPQVDLYHAHNLYLQVGVDLGIPGLAAFISILTVGLTVAARRVCSTCQNHWTDLYAVSLGLGTGLIAIMLHGFVDCPLWDYHPAVILWVMLGLIGAVAKIDRAETHLTH